MNTCGIGTGFTAPVAERDDGLVKRAAWLLGISVLALAVSGCSNHAPAPPRQAPGNVPGTVLTPADAAYAIAVAPQPGDSVQPVGSWDNKVLLKRESGAKPGVHGRLSFELLAVEAKVLTPLWTVPEGKQESLWGLDGDWAALTQTGPSLPFADWSVVLRNLRTGEARTIAEDDPSITSFQDLDPVLPLGFAPTPSIAGHTAIWVETVPNGDHSGAIHRIRSYDLDSGLTSTLVQDNDASTQRLYFPAAGGGKLAWASWDSPEGPYHISVRDLATGATSELPDVGMVFDVKLTADGRYLAWSNPDGVFAVDLQTARRSKVATGRLGTIVNGHYLSWATNPLTGGQNDGGYYDFTTGRSASVVASPGHAMNVAQVVGAWFCWQDIPRNGDGGTAQYYFVPVT